ncbi:MAG: hypothetical protein AAGC96_00820 [Pseudomonadota bacterium]
MKPKDAGLFKDLPADTVRVGLLVSDPATDYPVSSHSGSAVFEWSDRRHHCPPHCPIWQLARHCLPTKD